MHTARGYSDIILAHNRVSAVLATIAGFLLFAGALVAAVPLLRAIKRRVLWRVRRKLTISYIFIGFVPAMLIIAFFLLCGLLLFFNTAGYMVRSRAAALVDDTEFLAQSAARDVARAATRAEVSAALDRVHAAAAVRYPTVSYAVVPGERACGSAPVEEDGVRADVILVGAWPPLAAPQSIPPWVPCSGHAGLVTQRENGLAHVAARGVVWIDAAGPSRAVVVDVPLSPVFARELKEDTGIVIAGEGAAAAQPDDGLQWVAFLEYTDWATGEADPMTVAFRMNVADLYNRVAGAPLIPTGAFNVGQFLLVLVAAVGGLFLVIQVVALGMGLGLARTITGAIHDLFAGTARIRQGDFTHRIPIRRRDQLGELAESFNSMTASVEDLMEQKAEKERLEQELRMARDIQMSLLPQGPVRMAGLALTAFCEPAREVGGDYYDYLPINEHTLGVLIADVAGKGTSAALYMAELKGLMLALSQLHWSPRALLIDANRLLSQQLDSRSFITMTYLVVDLQARTLTHARAGHCPLIYLPGTSRSSPRLQMLSPDGLVLGLQIDKGETFNRLLEEVTVPIATGDLFVLYTDGLTDATSESGDWFGDGRLVALIEKHGALPLDELRERMLREVHAFAGSAPQHDDMTWVLLRIEDLDGDGDGDGPEGASLQRGKG